MTLSLAQIFPYTSTLLATYRIADIISYQMCILLVDSQQKTWKLASIRRSFLSAMINIIEIIIAFAIIYLVTGSIVSNDCYDKVVSSPVNAAYFSFVTFTTLGYGDFIPKNEHARLIVITQITCQVLFLLAVVPALVSNIVSQFSNREYKNPNSQDKNTN
ncbi:ion channel [Microbulbifer sp. VTAC004]|uniref:ion channel n=1 Tax=unclassified Microbulbifer TaxID=2619833 RepID=UPI004039C260